MRASLISSLRNRSTSTSLKKEKNLTKSEAGQPDSVVLASSVPVHALCFLPEPRSPPPTRSPPQINILLLLLLVIKRRFDAVRRAHADTLHDRRPLRGAKVSNGEAVRAERVGLSSSSYERLPPFGRV